MNTQLHKTFLFTFIISVIFCHNTFSQIHSSVFGKVTKDDLLMNKYEKDSTANAVVLNDYVFRTIEKGQYLPWNKLKLPDTRKAGNYYDRLALRDYLLVTETSRRIKILSNEGLKHAKIQIPFNTRTRYAEEQIEEIKGWNYSIQNSEIKKIPLEKADIKKIKVNDTVDIVELNFPTVKVGDVVEYQYKRQSPYYLGTPDMNFQDEKLPIKDFNYELLLPEAFVYNISLKGVDSVAIRDTTYKMNLTKWGQLDFSSRDTRDLLFTAKNLLPFQPEKYIYNIEENKTGVQHELAATRFLGRVLYAEKWKNIDDRIKFETVFMDNFSKPNYFKEQLKPRIDLLSDKNLKIETVLEYITGKVKWNGKYDLFGDPALAYKTNEGSSSQINFLIMSALKSFGVEVNPVLMSTRSNGNISLLYPSYDKLNTFILEVKGDDDMLYYIDGTTPFGGLNILPINLQVGRARKFDPLYGNSSLVNLSNLGKNIQLFNIDAEVVEDGSMQGLSDNYYRDNAAFEFKKSYFTDTLNYLKNLEKRNKITITAHKLGSGKYTTAKVHETVSFTKQVDKTEKIIRFNPLVLLPEMKYELPDSIRKLPLELDIPYTQKINATIRIPQGYKVISLPEMSRNAVEGGGMTYEYKVTESEGVIQVFYEFAIKQTMFPSYYYKAVKKFLDLKQSMDSTSEVVLEKK